MWEMKRGEGQDQGCDRGSSKTSALKDGIKKKLSEKRKNLFQRGLNTRKKICTRNAEQKKNVVLIGKKGKKGGFKQKK